MTTPQSEKPQSRGEDMPEELVIDTKGWPHITCDKCGTTTAFQPDYPEQEQVCMGCSPYALPKEEENV